MYIVTPSGNYAIIFGSISLHPKFNLLLQVLTDAGIIVKIEILEGDDHFTTIQKLGDISYHLTKVSALVQKKRMEICLFPFIKCTDNTNNIK